MTWDISGDQEKRFLLPFGDERAMVSTYHLTVAVNEVIAGSGASASGRVTVGLSLNPSIELSEVEDAYGDLDAAGHLTFPLLGSGDPVQPHGVTLADLRRLARDAH